MTTIKELESAVQELSKSDLSAFRAWFEEYDAELWDNEFKEDIRTGKLDKVAEIAVSEYKAGKCREL